MVESLKAEKHSKHCSGCHDKQAHSGFPCGTLKDDVFEMTDNAVLFDGSKCSNIEHFRSYFENIAEQNVEGKKARALIKYLREVAVQFCKERLAVGGKLSTEGKSYEHVWSVLGSQYCMNKTPARLIDYALSLKLVGINH